MADFYETCELMTFKYNEMKKKFEENRLMEMKEDCLLFFGPSKTGKSTLLIRIKSKKDVNEFMDLIHSTEMDDTDEVIVEGIAMKGGQASCTIVPNLYKLKDKNLLDLAGFCDPNKDKGPVIALINSLIIPKLNTCKILFVMSLNLLESFNVTLEPYMRELSNIMHGGNVTLGIGSCGFVFTKVDKYRESFMNSFSRSHPHIKTLRGAVNARLTKLIEDLAIEDSEMSKIAASMKRNYCLIDYTKMNQDEVIDEVYKVISKINNDINSRQALIQLEGTRGVIELMIDDSLKELEQCSTKFHSQLDEILGEIKSTKLDYTLNIKKLSDIIDDNTIKISNEKRLINDLNNRVDLMRVSKETKEKYLKDTEPKIEYHKKQRVLLLESFDKMRMLQSSIFHSVEWARIFKDIQRVTLTYEQPLNSIFDTKIYIMDSQEYIKKRDLIKRVISFKEFTEMKLPFLYCDGWDSKKQLDKVDVVRRDGTVQVHVETNKRHPFVVIFLTEVSVSNSPNEALVTAHFNDIITSITNDVESARTIIQNNSERIKEDMVEVGESRERLNEAEAAKSKARNNLDKMKDEHPKVLNQFGLRLDELNEQINQLVQNSKYRLTEQISEIIQIMVVNKSSYNKMAAIKNGLADMIKSIKVQKLHLQD